MYIRFDTEQVDLRTGKPIGIFTLAYDLLGESGLMHSQRQGIEDLLAYFKKELPIPTKFTPKKNSSHNTNTPGVSWLLSENREMVSCFWSLKAVFEDHGYHINVRIESHPGKIIYSDPYQVVVI